MADSRLDSAIDNKIDKEAKQEAETKEFLNDFIKHAREQGSNTDDNFIICFLKNLDVLVFDIFGDDLTRHHYLTKFNKYEKTKLIFFQSLEKLLLSFYQAKHSTKPIKVIDYETALSALESIELAINYCGDQEAERRYHDGWRDSYETDYEASKEYFLFKRYLTDTYFSEAKTLQEKYASSTQDAKNSFNNTLCKVCDFYGIDATTPIKRGELSNKIQKYFLPKLEAN